MGTAEGSFVVQDVLLEGQEGSGSSWWSQLHNIVALLDITDLYALKWMELYILYIMGSICKNHACWGFPGVRPPYLAALETINMVNFSWSYRWDIYVLIWRTSLMSSGSFPCAYWESECFQFCLWFFCALSCLGCKDFKISYSPFLHHASCPYFWPFNHFNICAKEIPFGLWLKWHQWW